MKSKEKSIIALQYAIGVDLGGTKIELGIVDDSGGIHHQQRLVTLSKEGHQAVEKQLLDAIKSLIKQANVPILGIGIGAAGQIQPKTGHIIFAPNLNWHNVPLQAIMEQELKIPVRLLNDVRAITLAEWHYGAGKGYDDLLCVFIGTGIGGGVVSGGRLLTGCSNTFGEVGHMTVDINGPLCTCGKRGCFEAIASGWGIAARAKEAIQTWENGRSSLILQLAKGQLDAITAKIVIQAYHEKDQLALKLWEQTEKALVAGFSSLINGYNPCLLILGGGLIEGTPELINLIDDGIRKNALKAATQSLEVVKAKLGKEVGVIGAATAIFSSFNQKREV